LIEISVSTSKRTELVDITTEIRKAVRQAGAENALCTIFVPHTTAAVTINENADPDVVHDILQVLNTIVPFINAGYRHMEGNSAAHVKSSLVGCAQTVVVEKGELRLGTWQGIYFAEFDGPRSRKVWIAFSPLL
jgi:secondary thiamine-phosphate synthase enzyme